MSSLSIANVIAYVIQVSLIAAVTGAFMTLLRVRNPDVRYWCWRALLLFAIALPLVQPWETVTVIVPPEPVSNVVTGILASSTLAAPAQSLELNPVLVAIIAGMTLRLLWLTAGAIRLRRIARRAHSDLADAAALQELIDTAADIRYSRDLAQPATCGIRQPVVLLPVRLRTLNAAIRRAVLAHELVHVRRRDWTALMLEEILRAVFWFNPAVWWLVDRVHAAREEVVDAEAVLYVDGRRSYIDALLAFASAPAIAAAPAFAHRRHLFSRIKRLCEESTMSSKRFLVTTCLLAVAIATSTLYAVNAFPLRAGDDLLLAPDAPAGLVATESIAPVLPPPGSTVTAPAPAGSVPVVAATQGQRPDRPVWLDLKDADLPATLRAIAQHGGRTADVDPSIAGKVNASLNNVPWEQALAFVMRANRLTSVTEGDTIRIAPAPEVTSASPPAGQGQQPPTTSVRIGQTPKVIRDVKPSYPPDAMRAGIEGSVEIEVTIGDDGKVTSSRVIQSSDPVFDQAALTAANQWLFSKPTEGPVVRTIELTFSLRPNRRNADETTGFAAREVAPEAVRIGGNIRAPMKIKHVSPVYPEIAKAAAVKGMVIIEALVDREGHVADAVVLRSIPLLDQAALDAVRQWTFTPTLLNGNPVQVIMTVTVNFTPEGQP
jgi:TonB family protein